MGKLVLAGALACAAMAACGDDGDATADDSAVVTDAGGDEAPDAGDDEAPDAGDDEAPDAGDDAGGDDDIVSDDVRIGAVATGIEVALNADRVEVDGDTIHVYMSEDSFAIPGAECTVVRGASAEIPDGVSVVLHIDGNETTC